MSPSYITRALTPPTLTRTNQVEDDFDEAETGGPAAAQPEVKPEAAAEAAPVKQHGPSAALALALASALAVPQPWAPGRTPAWLCAFSGRSGRLRAARHFQGEAQPPGSRQYLGSISAVPRCSQLAASLVASIVASVVAPSPRLGAMQVKKKAKKEKARKVVADDDDDGGLAL